MPVLSHLKGINKPEEKSEIEFVNNPYNYVNAAIESWYETCKPVIPQKGLFIIKRDLHITEKLYEEALMLVNKNMNGIETKQLFSCFDKYPLIEKKFGNIFVSALINKGCIDEIVFENSGLDYLQGYHLERGHVINKEKCFISDIGTLANGGLIENYYLCSLLGLNASGSVIIINYKFAINVAEEAKGGIHINLRHANTFSRCTEDGFFLNLGIITVSAGKQAAIFGKDYLPGEFGTKSKGGIHINGINTQLHLMEEASDDAIGISYQQLSNDLTLRNYLNRINYFLVKKTVKENQDEIRTIVKEIKAYLK